MSVDGFITLLALLVAVYALIPRFKQLELRLSITFLDWLFGALTFVLVLYLQFYGFFVASELNLGLGLRKQGLNPDRIAYIVSLLSIVFLWLRLKRRPLNRKSIFRFRDFIDELISDKRWAELCSVIDARMEQLFKLYRSDIFFEKLRNKLRPNWGSSLAYMTEFQFSEMLHQLAETNSATAPARPPLQKIKRLAAKIFKPFYFIIDRVLPKYKLSRECAEEIVEEVFLTKHVVEQLSIHRPYLAVRMVQFPFSERRDFIDLFLRFQIKDRKSTLYKEIQRNMSSTGFPSRYIFPDRNKLLVTFVKNSKLAVDLQVWRPVAEGALSFLDALHLNGNDVYDDEPLNFEEGSEDRKDCPIQNAIYFYDLMITEAFYSKEPWHMWLYYMTTFTRKILRNMLNHASSGTQRTSRYHYLLEEITSKLRDWIQLIEHSDENPENTTLDKVDIDHENNNIPKSAIICLGAVLDEITRSPKLSEEFKAALCEPQLDLYFSLKLEFKKPDYASVLIISLKDGSSFIGKSTNENWFPIWKLAWSGFDTVPYLGANNNVQDLKTLMFG